jgi:hypothetical protein
VGSPEVGAVLRTAGLHQLEVRGPGPVVDPGAIAVGRDGDHVRAGPPVDLGASQEAAP